MSQTFPVHVKVIAPYWIINTPGKLDYLIIKTDISELTKVINQVNKYLAYNFSISFNADWILVVQWMDINTCNEVRVIDTLYFNNCYFMVID